MGKNEELEIINLLRKLYKKEPPEKGRKFENVMSVINLALTIITIIVAIRIPKEIAEQQSEIDMFEKRYEVYYEMQTIKEFLDGYNSAWEKLSMIEGVQEEIPIKLDRKSMYASLWEGLHQSYFSEIDSVTAVLDKQRRIVYSFHYVFENITPEERALGEKFFNTYYSMTQQYVQEGEKSIAIYFDDPQQNYEICDISGLIEKMEKQLELE